MDFHEGVSFKGNSMTVFLTNGEHMNIGTSMYIKIFYFYYLHYLFLFFWIFMICPFLLVFLNFPDISHQKIFSWERRNIMGSPPLHNFLGIFYLEKSFKIQREIKREVFMLFLNDKNHYRMSDFWFECGLQSLFEFNVT